MLPPSCLQGLPVCCLVVSGLSPRCGLPVVSQMLFPSWSKVSAVVCCLLVFYLFPRCGLRIVFRLSSTIWIVSQTWLSNSRQFFFHLSPRCFQVVCRIWFPTSMFMFVLSCRLSTRSFGKVRPWWRTMNQHKHYMFFPWCYFSVMRLSSIFWFASAACHPRTIL
jgi:hypothetical protein